MFGVGAFGQLEFGGLPSLGLQRTFAATQSQATGMSAPVARAFAPNCGYAGLVMADAPLLYWRLGDAPGATRAIDAMQGAAAVVSGGVTFGAGDALVNDPDTAAAFDGTGLLDATPIATPTALTLEAWFRTSAAGITQGIIGQWAGNLGFLLRVNNSNHLSAYINATQVASGAGPSPIDGNWHHAAFTYDGATAGLYIDGAQLTTPGIAGPVGTPASPKLRIGSYSLSLNPFTGSLDEVALYAYALTSAQVAAHYAMGKSAVGVGQGQRRPRLTALDARTTVATQAQTANRTAIHGLSWEAHASQSATPTRAALALARALAAAQAGSLALRGTISPRAQAATQATSARYLASIAAGYGAAQSTSAVRSGGIARRVGATQTASASRRPTLARLTSTTQGASLSRARAISGTFALSEAQYTDRGGRSRAYAVTQASARSRSGALSRTWPSAQLASPTHRRALSRRATVAQSAVCASVVRRPGSVRLVLQAALVARPAARYLALAQAASASRSRALARRVASTAPSAAWHGGQRKVPRTLTAAQTQATTHGKVRFVSLHAAGLAAARRGRANVARTHSATQATGLVGHVTTVTFVVRPGQAQAVVETARRPLVGARVTVLVGRFEPLVSVARERRLLVEVS